MFVAPAASAHYGTHPCLFMYVIPLCICTGNSARSQLAEALTNHVRPGEWQAVSAGVHPQARAVLQECGVPTSALRSKHLDEFRDAGPDLVVTVCDSAARECPAWLGEGAVVHHPLPDPSHAIGSGDAKRNAFRRTRDRIRRELVDRLDELWDQAQP